MRGRSAGQLIRRATGRGAEGILRQDKGELAATAATEMTIDFLQFCVICVISGIVIISVTVYFGDRQVYQAVRRRFVTTGGAMVLDRATPCDPTMIKRNDYLL